MHQPDYIIHIRSNKVRQTAFQIEGVKNLTICKNEHIAIVGNNGAGKSVLVGILMGKYPMIGDGVKYHFENSDDHSVFKNIKYISFRDSYGSEDQDYYYQQRWNSADVEGRTRVIDALGTFQSSELQEQLFHLFGITTLMHKQLILLSSGEMRKFQIVKALLSSPRILIIDNPFIGLDIASRELLRRILQILTEKHLVQIILVLSRPSEIPEFITHIIPVKHRTCGKKMQRSDFYAFDTPINAISEQSKVTVRSFPPKQQTDEMIVEMHNLSIRYGEKYILRNLNLSIKRGEIWALLGENGSGKSTLLSLICADNPQSYACNIHLFGKKRGTGESIWDIKRRIGYVSPEMQRSYQKCIPAIDTVASGLYDTIGLYRKVHEEQRTISMQWMQIFGIAHLADRNFTELSNGEQRLVLLARAFVKNPDLIILDEPLHGLDDANRHLAQSIIEKFTRQPEKTAIIVSHYPEELPESITHRFHLTKQT